MKGKYILALSIIAILSLTGCETEKDVARPQIEETVEKSEESKDDNKAGEIVIVEEKADEENYSELLERQNTALEEAWGVSQEEIDANMENMTTEEFEEWLDQQDQEFNQRLEEAAKEVSDEVIGEALAEIQNQQPQQSQQSQAEVKQPQQTQEVKQPQQTQEPQETQKHGNDPGVIYNDDGSITLHTDSGMTLKIGGELSVRELSDLAKEATVN